MSLIIFELFFGKITKIQPQIIEKKGMDTQIKLNTKSLELIKKNSIYEELKELIELGIKFNPKQRISLEGLINKLRNI